MRHDTPYSKIEQPSAADYGELVRVWEGAVRSTHHFLCEADIAHIRTHLPTDYFPAVELYGIRGDGGQWAAFTGLSPEQIEMLFVAPEHQHKGLGRRLLDFAIGEKGLRCLECNEQNEVGLAFYRRYGFEVTGRLDLDHEGRPYPLLQLRYGLTPQLSTPRLLLRPFHEEDCAAVFACCSNPRLGQAAAWKPHENRDETLEVLRTHFLGQDNVWAIVERSGDALVGAVGLTRDDHAPAQNGTHMLGYWLREDRWGRGYMTEAATCVLDYTFSTLKPERISAYCYPDNDRSRRLLERLSFRCANCLEKAFTDYRGTVHDELHYVLSREDYEFLARQQNQASTPKRTEP